MTHSTGGSAEERFGADVREARDARGWTQDQLRRRLAAEVGIELSQTAMTRLEAGKRPIRLNEAVALAQVLIIGLDDYVTPSVDLTPEEVTKLEEAMETLQGKLFEAAREVAELDEQRRRKFEYIAALKRAEDMTLRQVNAAHRQIGARADGKR